ncbi:ATP-binding cassette domain-containing protein, partial [bacterium]|nr:ATP-binding cassette domain-containing protein [bacterium]
MISAYNIKKEYGDQLLFDNETFTIGDGERVGLVGKNGHGKTTLFRMIVGEELCDHGEIVIPKDYKIGYLSQHNKFKEPTILQETCLSLPKDEKDDHFKAKKILSGLGFSQSDFDKPCSLFSGGYQMRVALSKVLVSNPDMLLLDEPTNFLDIVSIRWLTSFLRSWKSELMVISHDRTFMDNIVTHILGIHRSQIRKMSGSTEHYYSQIRKEEDIYERRRENDEKIRKKEQDFIDKFRAKARRASQAQSRLKRLEKMDLLDKLGSVESLSFSFNYSPFPAKYLMEARDVCFNYNLSDPYLIDSFRMDILKNDKICIIGRNGAGKTTLLKLLTDKLNP